MIYGAGDRAGKGTEEAGPFSELQAASLLLLFEKLPLQELKSLRKALSRKQLKEG